MTATSNRPPVDVVVATYNGARYLPAWLDSIAAQSWPELTIVATDDASTDDSAAIVAGEQRRPTLLNRLPHNRGVRHSFEDALSRATAPYLFLADQDDVWHPEKVELMMARLTEAEQRLGRDHPILVSNHIPGCAMAFNRALLDRLMPMPPSTYIHDWWVSLVAATAGTMLYVDRPLIDWRQHGGNTLGFPGARVGKGRQLLRYVKRVAFGPLAMLRRYRRNAGVIRANVAALRSAFGASLPAPAATVLDGLDSPRWRDRLAALSGARTGEARAASVILTAMLGPQWPGR